MPKKKLQAAIARNGGAVSNVVTKHEKLSEEGLGRLGMQALMKYYEK